MILPPEAIELLRSAPIERITDLWAAVHESFDTSLEAQAALGEADRFYLLCNVLGRADAFDPWLYARTREVEREPDDCLDLWAREHYKSTIITFAGITQEIIRDREITVGIFSHTKPTARKFLLQLKEEFETNKRLPELWPNVFWLDPKNESPKWSEEKGIVVKRSSNPKEATVEGHGLVDGQPIGAHFRLRVYDDVVTLESVSTPEQVKKTTYAHGLSDNLGAADPVTGLSRAWHVGTRYSFGDTYQDILDRKMLKPRVYAATENGLPDGKPVFLSQIAWDEKRRKQPTGILAAQMLQNPAAGNEALFRKEWLRFSDIRPRTMNAYVLVDPASSRKKTSDRTAMAVIGVDAGLNLWLLDGYHHRMKLSERWANMKSLRKHWIGQPGVLSVKVGYERYGTTSDLEYFEEQMGRDRDAWTVNELAWPSEGPGSKFDRIQRLEPDFRAGKFFMAQVTESPTKAQMAAENAGQSYRVFKPVKRRDENGDVYSLNKTLLQEFLVYPFAVHDDMLDACSRIYDIEAVPPVIIDQSSLEPASYADPT